MDGIFALEPWSFACNNKNITFIGFNGTILVALIPENFRRVFVTIARSLQ